MKIIYVCKHCQHSTRFEASAIVHTLSHRPGRGDPIEAIEA